RSAITEYKTAAVVDQHGQHEHQPYVKQAVASRGGDDGDDHCDGDHRDDWHGAVEPGKLSAEKVVVQQTGADRNDYHINNIDHHADEVDLDKCTGEQFHEQGRHEGRQEGGDCRHRDGEGYIGVGDIRHHVGGEATGYAADQNHT